MSKIYIIGIGPGNKENMSFEAFAKLKESDVIIGYKAYTELVKEFFPEKEIVASFMRKETERCEEVISYAEKDKTVALISSGDAGVYGMAGIMIEVLNNKNSDIELEVIAGITASNAAASILGAPIMHDYATISLSDLLTDWELIKKRIEHASIADFVICIYNPKSKKRITQIEEAREIMLKYKDPSTPVGIVKKAKREGQEHYISTLKDFLSYDIDMFTVLIVGNSNSYVKNGKMITPRGYKI